ncbi:hypothetical protein B0H67DRAFT_660524 [Lasiosphaeris hirsuta]|uniref:Uncharacterized protein n=1 Tax=Lasiosphaeris hirsuta TaxID=260670 RepID=A0AA40ANL1_9PEZI|nr:hypothetical protein B0H67DRAFT_660524 [Lasiosphaeris hirsuta]
MKSVTFVQANRATYLQDRLFLLNIGPAHYLEFVWIRELLYRRGPGAIQSLGVSGGPSLALPMEPWLHILQYVEHGIPRKPTFTLVKASAAPNTDATASTDKTVLRCVRHEFEGEPGDILGHVINQPSVWELERFFRHATPEHAAEINARTKPNIEAHHRLREASSSIGKHSTKNSDFGSFNPYPDRDPDDSDNEDDEHDTGPRMMNACEANGSLVHILDLLELPGTENAYYTTIHNNEQRPSLLYSDLTVPDVISRVYNGFCWVCSSSRSACLCCRCNLQIRVSLNLAPQIHEVRLQHRLEELGYN